MEDGKADYAPDKFEVVQVLGVDAGVWVDLERVVVVSGVFEKTIERVEHFVGKEEEEFTIKESEVRQPKEYR